MGTLGYGEKPVVESEVKAEYVTPVETEIEAGTEDCIDCNCGCGCCETEEDCSSEPSCEG